MLSRLIDGCSIRQAARHITSIMAQRESKKYSPLVYVQVDDKENTSFRSETGFTSLNWCQAIWKSQDKIQPFKPAQGE